MVDEIILVDDTKQNDTVAIPHELGLEVIRRPFNRDYGGNQKACYRRALSRGADIVVVVHPDHRHDPPMYPPAGGAHPDGCADAVFGSGMLGARAREGASLLWKYLARIALHSGFHACSRHFLQRVRFEANSDAFVFDSEIIAQGVLAGPRMAKIPIATGYFRKAWQIGVLVWLRYGLAILGLLVRYLAHGGRLRRCPALLPR